MPATLKIEDLRTSIKKSVADLKFAGKIDPEPSFFPDPGIIGYVIHTSELGGFDAGPIDKTATAITGQLGKPMIVLHGKDVLIGFVPTQILKF